MHMSMWPKRHTFPVTDEHGLGVVAVVFIGGGVEVGGDGDGVEVTPPEVDS